jgi:hypothetical protein
MKLGYLFGPAVVLGAALAAGQYPPLTPNSNGAPRPEPEHRLPMDQPEQVQPHAGARRTDAAQIKRDAAELAKLAGEIPPAVEQANKGILSKDLNDRLKRIEKLSKQLRRELYE